MVPVPGGVPSTTGVAVAWLLATLIDPVWMKLPVAGRYNSAVASAVVWSAPTPPTISTRPFVSRVAVCHSRADVIGPVEVNVPAAGLYSSAVAVTPVGDAPPSSRPPAIRTRPFGSSVAVWYWRLIAMEPVGVNVPVLGL